MSKEAKFYCDYCGKERKSVAGWIAIVSEDQRNRVVVSFPNSDDVVTPRLDFCSMEHLIAWLRERA